MNDTSRIPTTDTTRSADTARWPVLAQLADVSPESTIPRSAKLTALGGANYRVDPPQTAAASRQATVRAQSSELPTGSKTLRRHEPHMFERRGTVRAGNNPRRESPILPQSNPFSIPRARLVDSISPAVRFMTMLVLFTAAGTWIQIVSRHAPPVIETPEQPKTAAQQTIAPDKNAADNSVPLPTAAGPLETNSQSGARVGRSTDEDSANHGKSAASACPPAQPTVTPPRFLIAGPLPQVQTLEPPALDGGDAPAHSEGLEPNVESDETPAVAHHPGFQIETPTR